MKYSARAIVWLFLVATAAFSGHDIVSLFDRLGTVSIGWFRMSFLAPVFIDGIAWLGKIMRSRSLSERTNRVGLIYLGLGGAGSLAANIIAGETLGMRILGGLAVCGFILGEIALDRIEARHFGPTAEEIAADAARARRSEAARKAAVTRAANAGKAKPRRRRRVASTPASATVPVVDLDAELEPSSV